MAVHDTGRDGTGHRLMSVMYIIHFIRDSQAHWVQICIKWEPSSSGPEALKLFWSFCNHIFAIDILIRVVGDIAIVRKLFSARKLEAASVVTTVEFKSKARNGSL